MSLDDLRDQYKGLCQPKDTILKFNGATYRKLRHDMHQSKFGNTIKVEQSGVYRGEMDELNAKYDLAFSTTHNKHMALSLNKKKRWEVRKELVEQMSSLRADNGVDVCLYETRNRNEKKSNCIAVHKTQGQPVEIKKTFGNLDSIKRMSQIETMNKKKNKSQESGTAAAEPLRVPKKNRKCSKPGLNSRKESRDHSEVIVVDVDESDDEEDKIPYVQYQIEYAPHTDVLKYDVKKYVKDKKVGKSTTAKKVFSAKSSNGAHYSNEDFDDMSEEEEEVSNNNNNEWARPRPTAATVDLDDLIDQHLIRKVEKQSLEEAKSRFEAY